MMSPRREQPNDPPRPDTADTADTAGADTPSSTLARWYRTTARETVDRTEHLRAIASALDAARSATAGRDAARSATFGRVAPTPSRDRVPAANLLEASPAAARRWPWARAAALLVVAAGTAAGVMSWRDGRSQNGTPVVGHDVSGRRRSSAQDVGFALRLPDAAVRQVSLAGDFNGWDASTLPMVRDPVDGTWRVRIPLAPGRHTYSFVVDGTRWVIDPLAPRTVEGALGPANVIAVSGDS